MKKLSDYASDKTLQEAIRRRQALAELIALAAENVEADSEFILPEMLPEPETTATRIKAIWMKWSRRQRRIAKAAALAILAVLMLMTLFATNVAYSRAVLKPLPPATTSDVMGYLRGANVNITDVKVFGVPNVNWNASEEIQFEVHGSAETGVFLLLAYPSADKAGADAFRATFSSVYSKWKVVQLSNCILLSSPATPVYLQTLVEGDVMRFLIGQYRPFLQARLQMPG